MALRNGLAAATALALAVVGAGAYLPWIRPNPELAGERDAVPDILLPKLNAGLDGYAILVVLTVVLALVVAARVPRYRSRALVLAGAVAVVVPIYHVRTTSLTGFDGTFVPAPGWYLVVGGGAVLVLLGFGYAEVGQPSSTET